MTKNLDKIFINERINFIKELEPKGLEWLVANIADTQKAINMFNELKSYFRKLGCSNNRTKRLLSVLLGKKLYKKEGNQKNTPCVFKTDMLSSSRKYYPVYLTREHPEGYTTTITKLTKNENLYLRDFVFRVREDNASVASTSYAVFDSKGRYITEKALFGYSRKIQDFIGDTKYLATHEKQNIYNPLGFTLSTLTVPVKDKTLYLGVELEVGRKFNAPQSIVSSVINDLNPDFENKNYSFAFIKADSSIPNHTYGFEIVSAPATLAFHSTAWERFFDNSANFLRSYTLGTCGMHVHVSREAFGNKQCSSKLHIAKFVRFFNCEWNIDFISKVAGRTPNHYCATNPNLKISKIIKVTPEKKVVMQSIGNDRNKAINLLNSATIEVRIFRGNCKKEGFFKNLEFVHSVFYFTSQSGVSEHCLSYNNYLEWLKEPPQMKLYPHLTKWLVAREELEVKHINLTNQINTKTKGKQSLIKDYIQSVA